MRRIAVNDLEALLQGLPPREMQPADPASVPPAVKGEFIDDNGNAASRARCAAGNGLSSLTVGVA